MEGRTVRLGRKWCLAAALGAAAGSLALGCGQVEVVGEVPYDSCIFSDYANRNAEDLLQLSIVTFWVDPIENSAFKVLTRYVDQKECKVGETALDDRLELQEIFQTWVAKGKTLPDALQVNGGSDVLQWIFDVEVEDSKVCALDALAKRYSWHERYFEAALAPTRCRGHQMAIPLGIHRLNTVLVNPSAYAALEARGEAEGVTVPALEDLASPEDFLHVLELVGPLGVLGRNGKPLIPLALGSDSTWPISILAFENFLVAHPNNAYERLWKMAADVAPDELDVLRAELEKLVDETRRAVLASNAQDSGTWQDATHLVASGNALFTVMGDWSIAQLSDSEREAIVERRFPGTDSAYVYTPDSFAIPRIEENDGAAAHLWLREVLDQREPVMRFAEEKNAIPAQKNLTEEELSSWSRPELRESYRSFAECQDTESECRLLLAVSGLGPSPTWNPCFDRMVGWLATATGMPVPMQGELENSCDWPEPTNAKEARESFVNIVLEAAQQRFAAACRE